MGFGPTQKSIGTPASRLKAIAMMPGAGEPDGRREDGMSEKLSEFLAEHRASTFGLAPVSKAWAIKMAIALESELAQAKAELDSLRTWKRSVDEALNSGDGTYRP
jgi:hypothetical protein